MEYGDGIKSCYYVDEAGKMYDELDFVELAWGNERLAGIVRDLCHGQAPCTVLEEMIREGDVVQVGDVALALGDGEGRLAENLDRLLESAWQDLGDVPVDDWGTTETPWHGYPAGIDREEIWHDFDDLYSDGVYALMFPHERVNHSSSV